MVLLVARTRKRRRRVSRLSWTLKHCLHLCLRSDLVIHHVNCTFDHSNSRFWMLSSLSIAAGSQVQNVSREGKLNFGLRHCMRCTGVGQGSIAVISKGCICIIPEVGVLRLLLLPLFLHS